MAQQSNIDVSLSSAAGRYASALFDLAKESGSADAVLSDLERFEKMMLESADLRRLVASPVFTSNELVKAVDALLKRAGISGLASNFIRLAASKRRLFAVPSMIKAYRSLVKKAKGIVHAEVRLAEMPSDRLVAEIKAALKSVAGGDVDVKISIDPSLIGGIVAQIGSKMVDASLKTKLQSIRLAMKEA